MQLIFFLKTKQNKNETPYKSLARDSGFQPFAPSIFIFIFRVLLFLLIPTIKEVFSAKPRCSLNID